MRTSLVAVAVLLLTLPVLGQGGGVTASGWQARLDSGRADVNDLSFMAMGGGFHVTTGPHAIFWDSSNAASGSYTLSATFTQTKASSHPNSFGLFFGGQNLDGDDQRYTYFLIREDGQFLLKQRIGADTEDLTSGWAAHSAVNGLDGGRMTNTISVEVGASNVRFLSNGTELASLPKAGLSVDGIAGVRFSHQLDVHVGDFTVG
ncbi:MAG: hypothetical protein CL477_00875 [Acidobacteria bacterium]|jgi:hypothetical protein|nr:hypothetical protein [Acidobacteriota bacterium]HJN43052.1 hypothetical protein [Vicinamibacterales bacterium]|tara:strand:+ start:591 stop:1202 length:612 start_codon:yes stop_codon:yes gene_type:complete